MGGHFQQLLCLCLLCLSAIMSQHRVPASTLLIPRQGPSYKPPKRLTDCQTAILSCCSSPQSTYSQTARCFELNSCPGLNFVPVPCVHYPTVLLVLNYAAVILGCLRSIYATYVNL